MDNQKVHYCFTLSEEQLEYLRTKKYKVDRMECFVSLVVLAERKTKLVQLSKTQQVEVLPGQVMIDNTQLAKLWDKDRKTVPKIIEAMEALGISSSQMVGENRIHTLHSLSGWYMDGHFVYNDFGLRRNAARTAIVHEDVPPARVITTEVADGIGKGVEGSGTGNDNSHVGNVGVVSSADAHVSHPSPQSNDSGNVGMSVAEGKSSDIPHGNSSHPSADSPSSFVGADGKLNEGKRNEEPSAQQEGQPPQPDGIPSGGSGGSSQKPDDSNDTNGFHSDQ